MKTKVNKSDEFCKELTEKFCAMIESGVDPFTAAYSKMGGFARNAISGDIYGGVNQLVLGDFCEWENPYFLTFKQAKAAGGSVRRGEKGARCVYYNIMKKERPDGKEDKVPFMKFYTVFNIAQCENLDESKLKVTTHKLDRWHHSREEGAEAVVAAMPCAPAIKEIEGFAAPSYAPALDLVKMPTLAQYRTAPQFYRTLFHELAHSTGHKKRLNRRGVMETKGRMNADDGYSREELVAELASSYCLARLGIATEEVQKDTAAYLASWTKALREDTRAIMSASGKAFKAMQYIFGEYEAPAV